MLDFITRRRRTHPDRHRGTVLHRRHPTSKQIFAAQARHRAPLVRTICKALAGSADGNLRAGFFLDLLRRGFSPDDARRQLDTAIDWGRYGELFDYDSLSDEITADPAAGIHPGSSSTSTVVTT